MHIVIAVDSSSITSQHAYPVFHWQKCKGGNYRDENRPDSPRSAMAQHALKGVSLKAGGNRVQHRDRNAITHAQSAETEAPGEMQRIVELFQLVPDPKERYKQLLHYASKLEALPEELHAPQFKVEGCVSQVWVVPEYDTQHNALTYRADSDSQLTKGLAALLCNGLSGAPPEQIMQMSPNFIENLGLKQSLTPSRNNGFLNMFRKMQRQAAELHAEGCDNNGGQNGYLGNNNNDSNSSTPVADSIKRKVSPMIDALASYWILLATWH